MIIPSITKFTKYIAETYVKRLKNNSEDALELSLIIALDLTWCAKDIEITDELTQYVCESTLKNSVHRLRSFRKTAEYKKYYVDLMQEGLCYA